MSQYKWRICNDSPHNDSLHFNNDSPQLYNDSPQVYNDSPQINLIYKIVYMARLKCIWPFYSLYRVYSWISYAYVWKLYWTMSFYIICIAIKKVEFYGKCSVLTRDTSVIWSLYTYILCIYLMVLKRVEVYIYII